MYIILVEEPVGPRGWPVSPADLIPTLPSWMRINLLIISPLSFLKCLVLKSGCFGEACTWINRRQGPCSGPTYCLPGLWDNSLCVSFLIKKNCKSAHFQCHLVLRRKKNRASRHIPDNLRSRTRDQMSYALVDIQWSFLFPLKTKCLLNCPIHHGSTENRVDGFHRSTGAQITQEGILVYIKCIISSLCILEGLIYTSNNILVRFCLWRGNIGWRQLLKQRCQLIMQGITSRAGSPGLLSFPLSAPFLRNLWQPLRPGHNFTKHNIGSL